MVASLLSRRIYQLCWQCRLSAGPYISSRSFFSRTKTHYEVLGVKQDATEEEIKAAYKRLSKKYHPDTSSEVNAQEKFIAITEAYGTLSKPLSRRDYDLKLKYGPEHLEQKKREEQQQENETWRDKHYWQRTKEEDRQFRKWYYNEFGMGSRHSPNVLDPFFFLSGKQAIILAITLGICLQYARYRWLRSRMELSDTENMNRLKKMDEEKQHRLEWMKKEREKFKDAVDLELKKDDDVDLQSFIYKDSPITNTNPV
ncbi:uncharacterized protein LOC133183151 [Saccostrea echinata]|uniref:uncharacterized protein LOC133183151 n=1 Tax=Saccostrea echinata TaxID=191078 RepID=UPI002A7FE534|nr:uncharacterized protein LOC133183151 [Saccostrea echinata]